jgi:thiamine-phosphate pyrophosphorylase
MRPAPVLIAITDVTRGSFDDWLAQLERLLAAAVPDSVQVLLRDRQLPVRERRELGAHLRELTGRYAQALCVNDRLDLAVLLEADAVHLSESSVSVADAREFARRAGRAWSISRASHDPVDALATDADALLLAPVVEARKGRPALGVVALERARAAIGERSISAPASRLYALGGVTGANAGALIQAGADGVALIGGLLEADAPRRLVESLGIGR